MTTAQLHSSVALSMRSTAAATSRYPYATAGFWLFHGVLFAIIVLCYAAVIVGHPGHVIGALCYAIAYCGCGIQAAAVGHQGFHNALFRSRTPNMFLAHFTFLLAGVDGQLWHTRHLRNHHPHPNTHGHDADLDSSGFLRLAPFARFRWYHRFQHFYAPFVYCLGSIITVNILEPGLLKLELPRQKNFTARFLLFAGFILRKAAFYTIWLVAPVLLSGNLTWTCIALYYVIASIPVAWMLLPIGLAHYNHHASYFEESTEPEFAEHQIETTVDFSPNNRLMTLLYGGLNSHLAHHLFPGVASCHHPALYSELRSQAPELYDRKINLSLAQLFHSHFKLLRSLSREPAGLKRA